MLIQWCFHEAVGIDRAGLAYGKSSTEIVAEDFKPLLGRLDAEEAVADPFGSLDCAACKVALEARGDLLGPIVRITEQDDGSGAHGADFASHFFKAVLEVCTDSSWQKDREVEVKFCLALD